MNTNLQEKTRAHYNRPPFDFLTEEDERRIRDYQPVPFCDFVDQLLRPGERCLSR